MAVNKKKNSATKNSPIFAPNRGLAALLSQPSVTRVSENSGVVPLDQVRPCPIQPRKTFDDALLQELAASIKEYGLLQPLIVTPADVQAGYKYRIVAGERRYRACQLAGLKEVPIRIVIGDEGSLGEIALVENLQREDLTPVETAIALKTLMEEQKLTQAQLAKRIGWNRTAIANKLRLLQLPTPVLDLLDGGELSEGHGKALLALNEKEKIEEFADNAIKGGWSVRALSERVEYANTHKFTILFRAEPFKPWRPKGIAAVEKSVGFKIGVSRSGELSRVVLHSLSDIQVERLIELLDREASVFAASDAKPAADSPQNPEEKASAEPAKKTAKPASTENKATEPKPAAKKSTTKPTEKKALATSAKPARTAAKNAAK